jgi:hypothetical protein
MIRFVFCPQGLKLFICRDTCPAGLRDQRQIKKISLCALRASVVKKYSCKYTTVFKNKSTKQNLDHLYSWKFEELTKDQERKEA